MLKIFHTADVHLGLKFSSYPETLSKLLSEARFETLQRLVRLANEARCDVFAVCGDLFDNLRVAQRDVKRAASILSQFDGVAAVLPGNHDYRTAQEDDIWNVFSSTQPDRVLVLTERRAYSLRPFDIDATLYAAPCHDKHSKTNAVGWLSGRAREATHYQIGLAHGSFEGLTPDTEGDYYPMRKDDLVRHGLDLWLMGHIHVQFPVRPGVVDRIFYPATPEPDGFDCRHEGKAWILEVDEEKRITTRSVSTGQYRFQHETVKVNSLEDVEKLETRYGAPEFRRMLLKLNLIGSLDRAEFGEFIQVVERLKDRFLHLIPDVSSVTLRLTSEDIDREFTRESFPHRLLLELAGTPEDGAALQAAYDLIKEARSVGRAE